MPLQWSVMSDTHILCRHADTGNQTSGSELHRHLYRYGIDAALFPFRRPLQHLAGRTYVGNSGTWFRRNILDDGTHRTGNAQSHRYCFRLYRFRNILCSACGDRLYRSAVPLHETFPQRYTRFSGWIDCFHDR